MLVFILGELREARAQDVAWVVESWGSRLLHVKSLKWEL